MLDAVFEDLHTSSVFFALMGAVLSLLLHLTMFFDIGHDFRKLKS